MRFFNTPYYKNARKLHFCMALFPEGRLSAESYADSTLAQREPIMHWSSLSRRALVQGAPAKREGASRRAPTRSATQIFLITTAAPFPRRSHCSSKNVRESPIKAQKKALCTTKPQTAHLYGVRRSCLGSTGASFCTGTSRTKS